MEHKTFPYLLYLIKTYFDNSITAGIMERNAVIDMATAVLGDFVKDNPEHKTEIQADARRLRSEKMGDHLTENALKCKFNGTSIPMGYTIDNEQHFQIDPVTAPVVVEIFTMYDKGATMQQIVNDLHRFAV